MSNNSIYPFFSHDFFKCVMLLLELPEIAQAERVCKEWNKEIRNCALIWRNFFKEEGVPLVRSNSGEERNFREDFKTLRPITISGKVIGEYLGKVVEPIPDIQEKWFLKLQEADPFEKGKIILQNYAIIVIPTFVLREANSNHPFAFDGQGNLILAPNNFNPNNNAAAQEIEIPFSCKNLKVLSQRPLKGQKYLPVFRDPLLFCLPKPMSDRVVVYLIRKGVIQQSLGLTYPEQEKLVKENDFEVTSLRERAIFDAISILRSGKCHDNNGGFLVRTSDCDDSLRSIIRPQIGNFVPGVGLFADFNVRNWDHSASNKLGVVPGVLIDVEP